jgi:hypothetical protein
MVINESQNFTNPHASAVRFPPVAAEKKITLTRIFCLTMPPKVLYSIGCSIAVVRIGLEKLWTGVGLSNEMHLPGGL